MGMSDKLHLLYRFSRSADWLEVWVDLRTDPEIVDKRKKSLVVAGNWTPIRPSVDHFRTQTGCESRGSATLASFCYRSDSL